MIRISNQEKLNELNFKSDRQNIMSSAISQFQKAYLAIGVVMLLVVSGLIATPAQAQTPAAPQDEPKALTGATIHTGTGNVIEDATILFEDGKITEIGTNVDIPEGTSETDVSGKQIYPGLVDAYSQMGLYEIGAVDVTVDLQEYDRINPNVRAAVAFNPESRHIGVARSNGVLTSVSAPGGGLISGQSSVMMMDGWSWESMTIKPSAGLIVNWPSPDDENEYEEEIKELRDTFDNARAYRTAHRAMDDGEADHHDKDSRWEEMIPVFDGDIPVVVNANELRQIQDAITWAEDEQVELIILGGRDAHYVSDHLSRKDIPVIVTSVLTSPNRAWESYDSRYALPAKLYEAGVDFAIAGSASAPYANRLPYEAGASVAFGLPEDEAIRAVTQYPAQILGFDDRVGTLEAGKDATFLLTDGNPLEYETGIEQAYIEGRDIDMKDAHRQFYEKYREKVRQKREAAD